MLPFGSLWLPVLLSSVAIFVISSICWMVLPYHRSDYKRLPDEDAVRAALKKQGLEVGQYCVPMPASMKEMNDPAHVQKCEEGPNALILVRKNAKPSMGPYLAQWYLYGLLTCFVVGYVARLSLPAGAACLDVFRLTGATFMAITIVAQIPDSIWSGRPWSATFKQMIDGLLYSLAGAGIFCWLWPAAVTN